MALGRFDAIDVSTLEVADEKRLAAPLKVEVPVPAEAVVQDPNKQAVVSIAYLMVWDGRRKVEAVTRPRVTLSFDNVSLFRPRVTRSTRGFRRNKGVFRFQNSLKR